jgi:hypothetical protein
MFDPTIPPAAKDTGVQLRALAWGKDETPPLSIVQIAKVTGKSQATLYGHMRLLRIRGVLRWRPAGKTEIIVSFDPSFWNSGNLESEPDRPGVETLDLTGEKGTFQNSRKLEKPVKDLNQEAVKTKNKSSTFQNSRKLENGAGTNAIKDEYVRLLGYKPNAWAEGEAKAAQKIGEQYTVEQFAEAYSHYKDQPFWSDKRLSLRYLVGQMPEFVQSHKRAPKPTFREVA